MPLYQYECVDCGRGQEKVFTIDSRPQSVPCECGGIARKVMMIGAVIGDEMPAWMRHHEVTGVYRYDKDNKHKITTRSAFNKYLKDRNIIIESKNREF